MKFGICDLSVIPMRLNPSDKEEMINQVLFGEHFRIIEELKDWVKISLAHDNYEGWICNKQWEEIDKFTYERLTKETSTISIDVLESIEEKNYQTIVLGSILPSFKSGHAIINDKMFKFNGRSTQGYTDKKYIIENSLIYLNAPYLWGGRSPLGIDCSGLTQMIYRLQGINLPRDAEQQAEIGTTIESIKDTETGDLVFCNSNQKIKHVGIIVNNNHVIHASGKVRIDYLDEKGILDKISNKYTHNLHIIKRIY